MTLDDALATFVAESRELLEQMEGALLRVEQMPGDRDTIDAIFRAAHTIKGSAGLFGLDHIVSFTHVTESVLDKVRAGELRIDPDLAAILLEACDHVGLLVDAVAGGAPIDEAMRAEGERLRACLQDVLGAGDAPDGTGESVPAQVAAAERDVVVDASGAAGTDNWHLSLRFSPDVLRNGLDPLSFLRYLGTLGRIVHVVTLTGALPPLEDMNPETCYLGFEVSFHSDADKAAIESVFDFVRDDSRIRILPPRGKLSEYLQFISEMPQQEMLLGEILVQCGTLTEAELAQALRMQEEAGRHPPRPIGEVLIAQRMVCPTVVDAALAKQKKSKESKSGESNLIRVDADRLDALINQIGELIIAGAGVNLIARASGNAELLEAGSTLARLVEDVRASALNLRMVQIGSTFHRFQRVVHDVSRELGKDIELVVSGAETELDKTVVEKIGDPLLHLVRNAIDHGIEPADVRVASGKPARGTLRLNAYHDSGSIVIEVSDDGGGLHRDRILAKAIARGMVAPDAQLSDREIWNLVFEPGFSTAEQVSNLSGRGVGMDVVRRNIVALRGSIDLDSVEGEGTTVRIRLPLTLAIIDGFLVGVGKSAFVIPLDLVVECLELREEDRRAARERHYISLRGQVLPYVNLRELFDIEGEPARRENLVVVQHGESRVGLVVDQLMGEIQTVIKPLGRIFSQVNGIGGSTILGNGSVALILDIPALLHQGAQVAEQAAAIQGR
jgi:two-component system chemotaxis sensor kinase CheA